MFIVGYHFTKVFSLDFIILVFLLFFKNLHLNQTYYHHFIQSYHFLSLFLCHFEFKIEFQFIKLVAHLFLHFIFIHFRLVDHQEY
jgi:hypothetical protein